MKLREDFVLTKEQKFKKVNPNNYIGLIYFLLLIPQGHVIRESNLDRCLTNHLKRCRHGIDFSDIIIAMYISYFLTAASYFFNWFFHKQYNNQKLRFPPISQKTSQLNCRIDPRSWLQLVPWYHPPPLAALTNTHLMPLLRLSSLLRHDASHARRRFFVLLKCKQKAGNFPFIETNDTCCFIKAVKPRRLFSSWKFTATRKTLSNYWNID